MKKVWLFNTPLGWGYYFYFDNLHLYLVTTSSIYDLFMIPLNINFDSQKISKFTIDIGDELKKFDKLKELMKNAEEVDCRKYFYDSFTGYSNILNISPYHFYHRPHYTLQRYEYLKFFALLYNREEKINNILNI